MYHAAPLALLPRMDPTRDDVYDAWQSAHAEAHAAFRRWCNAARDAKCEAYTAYRAAADREDTALAALMTG